VAVILHLKQAYHYEALTPKLSTILYDCSNKGGYIKDVGQLYKEKNRHGKHMMK
jgi:hypothetical protein